jgi:hypothetical protein
MNVSAIEATSSSATRQSTAAQSSPAQKAPPPAPPARPAPAASVAALSTPAATVSTTSVPATVKPEDRAEYLALLKAFSGNVNAALAALAAKEATASSDAAANPPTGI